MSEQKYKLTSTQIAFAEKCMGRKLTTIELFILAKAIYEAKNFDIGQFQLNFEHSNDFHTKKFFSFAPYMNAIAKIEINEPRE